MTVSNKTRTWTATTLYTEGRRANKLLRAVRKSFLTPSELEEIPGYRTWVKGLKLLGFTEPVGGVIISEITDTLVKQGLISETTWYSLVGDFQTVRNRAILHVDVLTTHAPKSAYLSIESLVSYAHASPRDMISGLEANPSGGAGRNACRDRAREVFEENRDVLLPGMKIRVPYFRGFPPNRCKNTTAFATFDVAEFEPAWRNPEPGEADTLRESCRLFWNELQAIPTDSDQRIKKAFRQFPPGTNLDVIIAWFKQVFGSSYTELAMAPVDSPQSRLSG